jgi:hypothetical protein
VAVKDGPGARADNKACRGSGGAVTLVLAVATALVGRICVVKDPELDSRTGRIRGRNRWVSLEK